MPTKSKRLLVPLAVIGFAVPIVSIAQEKKIDEIVVTATKRAQTLQDIPVAVSVTTGETIEKAQILDINDLQSVVPSLRVSQLQNSINTNFTIRGFGNGANNPGIEPSVGVFIDGVYRSRSASAISDLPNLERIEVLSGPQSTLFGKNASAGVISVVTSKPSGETAGKVSATVGDYNQVVLKGYVESAFSDSAAFSVAASHNSRDGYVKNLYTGNDLNNRDRQAFRGQLLLSPSDATEVRIIADYDTLDEECCASVNIIAGPTSAAINAVGGSIVENDPEALTTYSNIDPMNDQDNGGISMQLDHDFGSTTFTSITSYRKLDSKYSIDADFTSAAALTSDIVMDIDTFTQEFRLASNGGERLDWMIGGFYFDESLYYFNDLPMGADNRPYLDFLVLAGTGQSNVLAGIEQALGLAPFSTFGVLGTGDTTVSTMDNQALSLFGQLDFELTDSLVATLGLNYTRDKKEASTEKTRYEPFAGIDLVQLGFAQAFTETTGLAPTPANIAMVPPQVLAALQAAAADPSRNPLLGLRSLQFLPPYVEYPNAVEDGKTDDDDLTYTLRLAYDFSDAVNLYAGVSTGFKASSFNLSRDARPLASDFAALQAAGLTVPNLIPGTRYAEPEEATVYEIGLKARFGQGSLNLALFDQSIEGFQSNVFQGTGFNLTNAGKQSTKGLEFDVTFYPVDSWQLKLAGTFLDAKYDEFTGADRDPLTGEVIDLSGEKVGGVTDTNLSLSSTYRFNIGSSDAFLRADYYYEDKTPIGDTVIGQFIRETKNLNMAAGITTESGLGYSLWVRNATDHASLITAFKSVAQAGSFTGYRTQPRTYGLTISKDF